MRNRPVHFLFVTAAIVMVTGCASTTQSEVKSDQNAVAETKPAPAPAAAAVPASNAMSYNVVRGDHLWGISSKPTIYGNPYQWPLIFKANRDRIEDADLIEPGQVFLIDKNPTSSDISAAVAHAKTRGEWTLGSSERSDGDYLSQYAMK